MKKIKPFVIAEIGSVHDGSFGNAIKLIELAAYCGADAVKFQTHISKEETLINAPSPKYFTDENRYEYFIRTSFSLDQLKLLVKKANSLGLDFISSPFSSKAVKLLMRANVNGIKIASGEVTNIPMLEEISKLNINIYLSSGMSNWNELDTAVKILSKYNKLTILQCTSIYPTEPKDVGLNIISELKNRYLHPVGLSDHTLTNTAAIAAFTLGAHTIEKHLTFSKFMYGSDAANSAEPNQFKYLTTSLKELSTMINKPVNKDKINKFLSMKKIFQKSIVARKKMKKNQIITLASLAFKKPGSGISPRSYNKLIGKRLKSDIKLDHIFSEKDFK